MRRLISAFLAAALLLTMAGCALAAPADARLADLDELDRQLQTRHYDFYSLVDAKTWARRVQAVRDRAATCTDREFCLAMVELVASLGDSHTMAWFPQSAQAEMPILPVQVDWFEDGLHLMAAPASLSAYLGRRIVSIGGLPVEEVVEKLSALISHDNEVFLKNQFRGFVSYADALKYAGVIEETGAAAFVFAEEGGEQEAVNIEAVPQAELANVNFAACPRERVPAAEQPQRVYEMREEGEALVIGYYACLEDPDLPMKDFVKQVEAKLDEGGYKKAVVDLRYNGGGDSAVLEPLIGLLKERGARGLSLYALIGGDTFSSALMNAVQLKRAGATLVGAPTGGSVNHYGEIQMFELKNLPLAVQCSTKFFQMDGAYGIEPLRPDVETPHAFADYVAGRDVELAAVLAR